eukprot:2719007-Lingulodinium_polyedra.AAC.1
MDAKLNGPLPCHRIYYVCDSKRAHAGLAHPPEENGPPNETTMLAWSLWGKLQDNVQIALGH